MKIDPVDKQTSNNSLIDYPTILAFGALTTIFISVVICLYKSAKNRIRRLEGRITDLTENQNLQNKLKDATKKKNNLKKQVKTILQNNNISSTTSTASTIPSTSQNNKTTQTNNKQSMQLLSPSPFEQKIDKTKKTEEDENLLNEKTKEEILNDLMKKIEDSEFDYEELKTIDWENISLPILLLKKPVEKIIEKDWFDFDDIERVRLLPWNKANDEFIFLILKLYVEKKQITNHSSFIIKPTKNSMIYPNSMNVASGKNTSIPQIVLHSSSEMSARYDLNYLLLEKTDVTQYINFHCCKHFLEKLMPHHDNEENYTNLFYHYVVHDKGLKELSKKERKRDIYNQYKRKIFEALYIINNDCSYDKLTLHDKISFLNTTHSVIETIPDKKFRIGHLDLFNSKNTTYYLLYDQIKEIIEKMFVDENNVVNVNLDSQSEKILRDITKKLGVTTIRFAENIDVEERVQFIQANYLQQKNTLYKTEETNERNFAINWSNGNRLTSLNRVFFEL